jgi:hypothetical protein
MNLSSDRPFHTVVQSREKRHRQALDACNRLRSSRREAPLEQVRSSRKVFLLHAREFCKEVLLERTEAHREAGEQFV